LTIVVRCNICDQKITTDTVQEHVQTPDHVSRKSELDKKVAIPKKTKFYPENDSSIHIWETGGGTDSYDVGKTTNRLN